MFLVLAIVGAAKFDRDGRKIATPAAFPPLSVLKPVHGVEPRLEENLESFFRQDYPRYEVLFAADEESDAALPIVRRVCARHPEIPSRVLVTGRPPWPNPPSWSFHNMAQVAANEILVTSDSDVEVAPSYLREVIPPLLDPAVGMITCVYRGKNAGGFWSGLDAIGMSVEMTAGVLVANLLEGIKFGLGPTIAVRKDALVKIGGYSVLGDYFANDFMIGNLIDKAGHRVVLSPHIIDHVVAPMTFAQMWRRQLRWAASTRTSRPKGHFGTGLIFAMPYGILGCVAAAALGMPVLAASLLGIALLNRIVEAEVVGWGVVRDPRARRAPWLYPVRDLFGFLLWCASYVTSGSKWRSSDYKLMPDGKIVRHTPAAAKQTAQAR
ncbi:MAG TPA: glycosyltransferase [Terriglobales bacterium]|nr:glycosyltransferase [Terriglobales bacterium]